jgi:clan AA aspartic protease (TIGR02281 family)
MKLSGTVGATLVFAQVLSGLALTPPSLAENPLAIAPRVAEKAIAQQNPQPIAPPSASPSTPTQQPSSAPNSLGREIFQQLIQCLGESIGNPQQPPSKETLEATSMKCVFKVVMLAPDGSIRPDASERLTALFKTTGINMPKPTSQGQASVQLQPLPDSRVFTVPVTIAGQSKRFLFDTGASNSIVESQIAQQLGLAGTPVPKELLEYMVVGDNCSDVKAMLHTLPTLTVDAAKVEGISGMGLPKTAIVGNLSGVLGLDFLSGFDVVLNPKTLQLKLLPPSTPTGDIIPLQGKLGVMTAQVQINGQGPFTFLLDTGADSMVVSERLAKQLSLDISKAEKVEVRGFCGTEQGKQTKLAQVRLQQHQANDIDTVVLGRGVLDLLGVDGIVGQNFLNQYQQHWRFGELNELGFPEKGSLVLSPL